MLVFLWLFFVFVIGVVVGSFLNVCISRLPLEKSILWPGSRCGSCYQPVRWFDNLPLISYLLLRGKCRTCGSKFSMRYFWVELLTGFGFAGLFYLEVVLNIHQWNPNLAQPWAVDVGIFPWQWVAGFFYHAILFAFLMAVSFCDLDDRNIPLSIPLTGTAIGLIGAVLMPWPWPSTPERALSAIHQFEQSKNVGEISWWDLPETIHLGGGVYAWPVWGPLPEWVKPGGNWQMGLAVGLAGALAGTLMLRAIRFLFTKGLGKESLGLGDADLMMMAGAFLGWQPVVVAFFLSVFPALFVGIFLLIRHKDESLPFGPSLSLGILITMLGWRWIAPQVQVLFFFGPALIFLAIFGGGFMFFFSFLLRIMRGTGSSTTSSEA